MVFPGDDEYTDGCNLYKFGKVIDAKDLFAQLESDTTTFGSDSILAKTVVHVHLYCDTLIFSPDSPSTSASWSIVKSGIRSLTVFSRCFLAIDSNATGYCSTLQINGAQSLQLNVFFEECAPGLAFQPDTTASSQSPLVVDVQAIPISTAGQSVLFSSTSLSRIWLQNVRAMEFEKKPMEPPAVNGDSRPLSYYNYLTKLLQSMFGEATEQPVQSQGQVANDILSRHRFVVRCCGNITSQARLAQQARMMVSLIGAGQSVLGTYVPILNFDTYLQSLEFNLSTAQNFENSVTALTIQSASQDTVVQITKEMQDTSSNFTGAIQADQDNLAKVAEAQLDNARARSAKTQNNLEYYYNLFNQGLNSWLSSKMDSESTHMLLTTFSLAWSMAKCVMSEGAAGPEVVKSAAELYNLIKEVKEIQKDFAEVAQAFASAASDMALNLSQMNDAWGSLKALADKIRSLPGDMDPQDKMNTINAGIIGLSQGNPVDFLGVIDQIDTTKGHMDDLFTNLDAITKSDTINGEVDYKRSIITWSQQGKQLLQAFQGALQAEDAFVRAAAANAAAAARQAELQQDLQDAIQKEQSIDDVKQGLQDELSIVTRSIYMAFFQLILAYMYSNMTQSSPLPPIPVDQTMSQYLQNRSDLFNAWTSSQAHLSGVQTISNVVFDSTTDSDVFGTEWKTSLLQGGVVSFDIPAMSPQVDYYYRVRMSELTVTLDGIENKTTTPQDLPIHIVIGPKISQKTPARTALSYYIDPSTRLYQTGPTTSRAQWGNTEENKYIQPALGCQGAIYVKDEELAGKWDLTTVKSVQLDFTCMGIAFP